MDLSKTDIRVLGKVAASPVPLCAFEISKDFGGRSGSHIQKSCKHLVECGLFDADNQKNEKNAPKKVFRLSLLGFCYYIARSGEFSGFYEFPSIQTKNQKVCQVVERWAHLDESIGCFYSLFLKTQMSSLVIALGEACTKTIQTIEIMGDKKRIKNCSNLFP